MVKGRSGRIVIEIDPDLKNQLYSILARDGRTLKDWFIEKAIKQIELRSQRQLTLDNMLKKGIASKRKEG